MDINLWKSAEQWSNYTLPSLVLFVLVFFMFFGLIPFMYTRTKATKILFGSSVVMMVLVGLSIYIQNNRFREYTKESKYVTATTRAYTVSWWHKVYYDHNEIEAMKYIAAYEFPSHLSMYKREKVEQDVQYLGREEYYVYLGYKGETMRYKIEDVKMTNRDSAYLSGYKFTLKDKAYLKIGFFNLPNYFRKDVYIPKKILDKPASAHLKEYYGRPGLAGKWIVDSAK